MHTNNNNLFIINLNIITLLIINISFHVKQKYTEATDQFRFDGNSINCSNSSSNLVILLVPIYSSVVTPLSW